MGALSEKEQQRIQTAIASAERETSGEIRICIEKSFKGNVLDRAVYYFDKLDMDQTALRNGVLIYIATEDHKFAIIGDAGINKVVPADFWESTKEAMRAHFKGNQLAEGIIAGIQLAGEQLKKFFPFRDDDKNELSDDIHIQGW